VPNSYDQLAQAYTAERPLYERLAAYVEEQLRLELTRRGIHAAVSSRAKEVESLVVKALFSGNPLDRIRDKAGVRVVVAYQRDISDVERAARAVVDVRRREEKLEALAYDQSGYLGVHLDAMLFPSGEQDARKELLEHWLEIQIRTLAQAAWAEPSHDLLYKPAAEVPDELKRSIYRLVSLVELIDLEIEAFRKEAEKTAGYREAELLVPLQKELLQRFGVTRRPNRQLSLHVAAAVVPLYTGPQEQVFETTLLPWIETNQEALDQRFRESESLQGNPLLLQPEALMIYERLNNDKVHLEQAWPEVLPQAWLSEFADSWGTNVFG
jgi:ppGpp synthetase/RelA/SpoT-type nucleotidyltranferase